MVSSVDRTVGKYSGYSVLGKKKALCTVMVSNDYHSLKGCSVAKRKKKFSFSVNVQGVTYIYGLSGKLSQEIPEVMQALKYLASGAG